MMSLSPTLRRIPNFFPTPAPVIDRLLDGLNILPGETILEPSAGDGHILRALARRYPAARLLACEIEHPLRVSLKRQGFQVIGGDLFDTRVEVDAVVGNAPFRNNFQDIDHFRYCYGLLKPGGRIRMVVHAMSCFPTYRTGKPASFCLWLNKIGAYKERLPAGSFLTSDRPTNTETAIVWATKPMSSNAS